MFRGFLLSLALAACALIASPSTAQAQLRLEYTYAGTQFGYTGYQFCYETNRIAAENDFANNATQYAVDYAYYSFIYGYYGLLYDYADWMLQAGELADGGKEVSKGIYEYAYYTLYPEYPYPQVGAVIDNSFWAWYYLAYAEVYYKAGFSAAIE